MSRGDADREKLIGYIDRMHDVNCSIRLIDRVSIGAQERHFRSSYNLFLPSC